MGEEPKQARPQEQQYPQPALFVVWDWPLRVWHWALALSVSTAWLTPSTYDRAHRIAGYIVVGLLVFRLVWALAGNRYARLRRLGPKLRAAPSYLWNLRRGKTGRYLGLNPAGAAMLVALLATLIVSSITGIMQVTVAFFGVWWVEDGHAWVSHAVVALAIVHVIGTIAMSILQKENLPKSMITGRKRRRL